MHMLRIFAMTAPALVSLPYADAVSRMRTKAHLPPAPASASSTPGDARVATPAVTEHQQGHALAADDDVKERRRRRLKAVKKAKLA